MQREIFDFGIASQEHTCPKREYLSARSYIHKHILQRRLLSWTHISRLEHIFNVDEGLCSSRQNTHCAFSHVFVVSHTLLVLHRYTRAHSDVSERVLFSAPGASMR